MLLEMAFLMLYFSKTINGMTKIKSVYAKIIINHETKKTLSESNTKVIADSKIWKIKAKKNTCIPCFWVKTLKTTSSVGSCCLSTLSHKRNNPAETTPKKPKINA